MWHTSLPAGGLGGAPSRANVLPMSNPGRNTMACRSGRGRSGGPDLLGEGLLLGGRSAPASNKPPPKLVLPGQGGPPRPGGGRLLIPVDKNTEKLLIQGAEKLGAEAVTVTGPNRYRPPAGFMNETPDDNSEVTSLPPDVMLSKLRSRAGKWHQLAKMLAPLALAGYDNNTVDEMTGITPVVQSRWQVASTVYDSLVASKQMPADQLAKFDQKGDELLLPFRFLTQEMRVEAAEYILAKSLDAPACDILARSMKEWERRPSERLGFSDKPGDCMAFKYLRDALECRKMEDAEAMMAKAIDTAITDSARTRLVEALDTLRGNDSSRDVATDGVSGLASLMVLRLDPEDIGFRPIPLLGALGLADQTDLDTAPRTSQEGAFGAFSIDSQGAKCRWVALPQWKALAMMRHPVALSVADCSTAQGIIEGTRVKTDDDRRRLIGPGLVLADRCETSPADADESTYYLAVTGTTGAQAKLSLVEGAKIKARGLTAQATVVFVARPPAREQPALPATSNESLLQL